MELQGKNSQIHYYNWRHQQICIINWQTQQAENKEGCSQTQKHHPSTGFR